MKIEGENKQKGLLIVALVLLTFIGVIAGVVMDRFIGADIIDKYLSGVVPENVLPRISTQTNSESGLLIEKKIVSEESLVIDVVKSASPSVVTIGIKKTEQVIQGGPLSELFDPFGFFGNGRRQQPQIEERNIEQNIGTGFVVSSDGMIVSNKHVVADTDAQYTVITADGKEYNVENIYRDPTLDLSILKIPATDLKPIPLGDSDRLEVGQFVIAIGTALGEFRNTVTTGVVSGLGRGIEAGDVIGSYSETLDDVIQTDAAINPGNSGGPLLNSEGQVIGVNVATSVGADNISFAIPINVIKDSINNFNKTGKFDRAFLGVKYKMISRDLAILNDIPEGAYLVEVVDGSPAAKAGLKQGDIVMKMDGKNLGDIEGGLATVISQHKVGDRIRIEYYSGGERKTADIVLHSQGTGQ
jgi:serine protease Do